MKKPIISAHFDKQSDDLSKQVGALKVLCKYDGVFAVVVFANVGGAITTVPIPEPIVYIYTGNY